MKPKTRLKLINFWPPFLGAGIKVKSLSEDLRDIKVEMNLTKFNTNYVGVHYGGSIYSMTDPFYMLMLIENLGKDYIVWDKAAHVKFIKPGTGKLTAHFNLSAERLADIKKAADDNYKTEPKFIVHVRDEKGDIVAEVEKTVYVRRKDKVPIKAKRS